MDKVVKSSFSTVNTGELQSNGGWKVTTVIEETVTLESGDSHTEKIDAMCFDDNYVRAQQTALASALVQYREEVLDQGFSGLVEARLASKEQEDDSGEANSDTPTQ